MIPGRRAGGGFLRWGCGRRRGQKHDGIRDRSTDFRFGHGDGLTTRGRRSVQAGSSFQGLEETAFGFLQRLNVRQHVRYRRVAVLSFGRRRGEDVGLFDSVA